jgi:hypothetical protein
MKISTPLLLAALSGLGALYLGDPMADASPAPTSLASAAPLLHSLQRGHQPVVDAPRRDPFFGTEIRDKESPADKLPNPNAKPLPANFPAFRILGKQEDDQGWSVFITAPGHGGEVWVVRRGEVFAERFRVSKLAPPVLSISTLNGQQTKSFHIGNEEE